MVKIKRILLECTHTYETDLNTGIQRVVRNIVNESKHIADELGIECQPIILQQGYFWTLGKMKNKCSLRAAITAFLKNVYRKIRPLLRAVLPFRNIERFLFPAPGRIGLTTIVNIGLDILLLPISIMVYFQKKVSPQKGDLLLMLDSSWVYPIWPAVKKMKKRGAMVGLVTFDLIPITHSKFCVPALVKRFQSWFDQAMDNVDFFIGISQSTRDEVKRYIESNRPSDNWAGRFESFRLGSVIDNVVSNGEVRNELKKIFIENSDKPSTYLTVGTIEPRKNHKYLLDAFDKIWGQCPYTPLCIVGRIGWFCEEMDKYIKTHPKYGKYLFMFNDLSDTELDYCYRHAKALVSPSVTEGFGLPLVEALYHGRLVLASDIPIFREVGKDFCAYFDIRQPASLAKMIINIEKEQRMPKVRKPEEYNLPDWKDSCRELLSKTVALCEKIHI